MREITPPPPPPATRFQGLATVIGLFVFLTPINLFKWLGVEHPPRASTAPADHALVDFRINKAFQQSFSGTTKSQVTPLLAFEGFSLFLSFYR